MTSQMTSNITVSLLLYNMLTKTNDGLGTYASVSMILGRIPLKQPFIFLNNLLGQTQSGQLNIKNKKQIQRHSSEVILIKVDWLLEHTAQIKQNLFLDTKTTFYKWPIFALTSHCILQKTSQNFEQLSRYILPESVEIQRW